MRSVDWGEKLGAVAHVRPAGEARVSTGTSKYANAAQWTVK